MKIGIIAGSHRENSESERIAKYIEKNLKSLSASTFLFSLAKNPLPLFDEGLWKNEEPWMSKWTPVSRELVSCDGFVIISPEWSGMVPAGLKNFFLLIRSEFAHKPGMIVSVSSGISGSYPVVELRTSSYKNTRICYIPDHVIVRNCQTMLQEENPSNDHDKNLRIRINYSLKVLLEYSKAFGAIRESGIIDTKSFPHGM